LARLLHQAVTAKLPKVYEDTSGWGHTIPLPDRVRLPRARRTIVEVDGRLEVPDGFWRKIRLRMDNPDRDLRIHVRSLERLDATTYRLKLDTDAALHVDADLQRWRNGLLLADVVAQARVSVGAFVSCVVSSRLDTGSLPPRVRLEPDIKELKLEMKSFRADRVTFQRAGLTLDGEALEGLNEEFRDTLQRQLREKEPQIKKRATEALARQFKEDKNPIPLPALLDAAAPLLKATTRPPEK
jgi:hypothetical protein